jgi:hypothetical protein
VRVPPPAASTTRSTRRASLTCARKYEAALRLGLPRTFTEDVPLPFPVAAGLRLDEQARFHVRQYLLRS